MAKMKIKLKVACIRLFGGIVQLFRWLFPTKAAKENILQYLFRQVLLPDADGNPSVTTTILFAVMTLIGTIAVVEVKVALSTEFVYANGELVSKALKGFSGNFLLMAISLAGVVTYYFQKREQRRKEGDPNHPEIPDIRLPGVLENVKERIASMLEQSGKQSDK